MRGKKFRNQRSFRQTFPVNNVRSPLVQSRLFSYANNAMKKQIKYSCEKKIMEVAIFLPQQAGPHEKSQFLDIANCFKFQRLKSRSLSILSKRGTRKWCYCDKSDFSQSFKVADVGYWSRFTSICISVGSISDPFLKAYNILGLKWAKRK